MKQLPVSARPKKCQQTKMYQGTDSTVQASYTLSIYMEVYVNNLIVFIITWIIVILI